MVCTSCRFTTQRLVVQEWHSQSERTLEGLAGVVRAILTARVTQSLPTGWQGSYTLERAREWVRERDREGVTLLAVERSSSQPVGLLILTETKREAGGIEVRLGYVLAESVWGRGLATELVRGFVDWCRTAEVAAIVAGVMLDNAPSRRVLEKCGFSCRPETGSASEQEFELRLFPRRS